MKKLAITITFLLTFILGAYFTKHFVYSDEVDDLSKQISDLQASLDASRKATTPLESQLTNLKKQLDSIDYQVKAIEADIVTKKKDIAIGYSKLESKQKLINVTVRNSYIKNYAFSPLLVFASSNDASGITKLLAYQKRNAQQDKNVITSVALLLVDLEDRKIKLENEEKKLAVAKAFLDRDRAEIEKVVTGAKAYQATLSSKIASLSQKQQDLLAQKLGSLNIPRSAGSGGSCSSDIDPFKSPGFSPAFALFTFGVPNRVGLNQYGAFGRAKANQDSDTILRAYYNFDSYQNFNATIKVNDSNGYDSGNVIWTGSLEDYVKRIYEVPDSWTDNNLAALKAQSIAARSYVLAQTDNGNKSICATQSCQVFKTDPKGGNWEQAVNATSGQAMVQGGKPIAAYFSSTHGGYVYQSGGSIASRPWLKNAQDSSSSISSWDDLKNNAYDKASPWFYCDWGARPDYNKTAWLKSEEIADIANVILLARKDSSSKSHLYQTDSPNPEGTDTWDAGKVKQQLGGDAFNSISDVSVSADFSSGKTTSITISGNGKSQNFPASEFKDWFNLRAPKNIQIVGPLFNVERR